MASKFSAGVATVPDESRGEVEMVMDGFASVSEAAKFLHLSRASVYKLMGDEEGLRYAKFGRSRRIPWQVLRDYAARSIIG
jgi:excisionase family DNA binding protein